MRYVTLSEQYALRGWGNLAYGILDLNNAPMSQNVKILTPAQFDAIKLVTTAGISIDDNLIPKKIREMTEKAIKDGIFILCDKSKGLYDYQEYHYTKAKYTYCLLWSITGNCNLKCRHCYISADKNLYGELSFEKCIQIMDQMVEANISKVDITGGEPLVRKDFWQLLEALKKRKITIMTIYSNGFMIDDNFLDKLEKYDVCPNGFHISYDGWNCHDWLRGVNGAEKKAIEAIQMIKKRNYHVTVGTVLHMGNLSSLPETYELMKELGVDYWKVSAIADTGNWSRQENKEISDKAVKDEYLRLIKHYSAENAPLDIRLGAFFQCQKNHLEGWKTSFRTGCGTSERCNEHLCEIARVFPYLLPDGRLLPCVTMSGTKMEDIAPNIFDDGASLSKILHKSVIDDFCDKTYGDLFKNNEECDMCEHKFFCSSCRANVLYNGDFYDTDISSCIFNKYRYLDKIKVAMNYQID